MPRDNFNQRTLDRLSKRVGLRCSNPECGRITAGPRSEADDIVNIGVGAHITAAAAGGPRFAPELTDKARSAISNGIWLCQNCAKLIDNDPSRYTVKILHEWKTAAEESARLAVSGTTPEFVHADPAHLIESRRRRVEEWRAVVSAETYDFIDCRSTFLSSSAYASLRPYLRPEVVSKIEAPRMIYVGGARGDNVRQYTLLDEISRIEREWGLM